MKKLFRTLMDLAVSDTGVTSIEYALAASLIAVACVATVVVLGDTVEAFFVSTCKAFPGALC